MKKALFLSVALMCAASMGFAQEKAVKDAKRAANSQTNPDFAKAEQLINGALTNPETKDKANTWDVAGFIQRRKLEEETKKIIIPGTPYDTLGYYTSALNMCKYFFKCDELAQIPDEKNKVKNKYRKRNATTMMNERRNLYDGGVTFFNEGLKKSQAGDETGAADCNRKALDFWGTYVDMAGHEMFSEDDRQTMLADSMYTYAAYYATMVANAVKDYASVMKYAPIAEGNAENGKIAMEYLTIAYEAQGDTAKWLASLKEGMQKYPDHTVFFGRLIDYCSSHNRYDEAMQFADGMLQKDPSNPFFLYVKGYIFHNMEKYDDAIKFYTKAVEARPDYAEVYSNMGLAYSAQAQEFSAKASIDVNDPNYAKDQATLRSFYEKAKTCYEKARKLKPEQKNLWLSGLYRVYYNLDMGKELKEIEDMM